MSYAGPEHHTILFVLENVPRRLPSHAAEAPGLQGTALYLRKTLRAVRGDGTPRGHDGHGGVAPTGDLPRQHPVFFDSQVGLAGA